MWVLIVCATDGWAAGTPADSAWVQDTGGISVRAAFGPTPDTSDTGDSADSAESADTGETPIDTDTDADTDTDTDSDTDTDADTDDDTSGDDDTGEDVGCCSGGDESSMILGVGLALAVVLGRRRSAAG